MTVSRRFALVCQALVLSWAGTAMGQEKESAPPSCSLGAVSALSELGCELRRAIPKLPSGTLVVSAPIASDTPGKSSDSLNALGSRLAHVVAGALGAKANDGAATLATARTLASSAGTLFYLRPEIVQGELRIVADLYPVPKAFWDRVRDPHPSPSAHAFASRRLDAELRTFFPPVPLVAKQIDKATTSEPAPVAVGCGDVDADGALEIVLVGRHRISVGRIRKAKFVPFVTRAWADLSPLSRAPLREPIASIWIEPGRHVDIGLSDRLETIRFTPPFEPTKKLGRRLPWPGGGCAHLLGIEVKPAIEPCAPTDPAPRLARVERAADTLGGNHVPATNGQARLVRVARSSSEPTAILADDAGRSARIEHVGAQLAVGDLDGDGQPELVSGADVLDPGADALVVHTWQNDGRVTERLRVAVPTGVRALAICPPDSTGLSAIALATSSSLWVVR